MAAPVTTEAVVIGGGPAGLAAAALLGAAGVPTVLAAPPPPADTRTTALMQSSLDILARIKVWPGLAPQTGMLKKLRIADTSGGLIRAPEILFDSAELGLSAFGRNVENIHLLAALRRAVADIASITVLEAPAVSVTPQADFVQVNLENGATIRARLVVGADGHNSLCRTAGGIAAKTWSYPQSALTLNLLHSLPHDGISTEFHRRGGPLVVVPLPGDRSSLVLVNTHEEIERLAALDDGALGHELERLTHGLLGRIEPAGPRGTRRISGLSADVFAQNRIALVGEAAHVLPPIGAQGLNLGIRDAAAIAGFASAAVARGQDPGAPALLSAYDRERRSDANPRRMAIGFLNRSLIREFPLLDAARTAGLWALNTIPPLRRAVMRHGIGFTAH